MIVRLIVVGAPRSSLAPGIREYEARAARYWKLMVDEVAAGSGRGGRPSSDQVREKEGERILARLDRTATTIALTRGGKGMTSTGLARYLERCSLASIPEVAFVVGGAYGLGDEVIARAKITLSLSTMTLPHELARLVLGEQLYRAGTIRRGEPYHKGNG